MSNLVKNIDPNMVHKSKSRSRERSEENDIKPFIKKEKLEERVLHPMSFYADNRLELVKQVFGTLKPKTIRNLAPEHIRDETMEQLEETVLNELMCISTKRLRSIINASRCPTDTESSEDTDVEHKEQHVSLEEISSDSDIDNKKKGKKGPKKNTNVQVENGDGSKISILELLELQARARAIRSQLALEPVTKIELGSDTEEKPVESEEPINSNGNQISSRPSSRNSSKVAQTSALLNGNLSSPSTITLMADEMSLSAETTSENIPGASAGVPVTTKFRLQRNYRQKSDIKKDNQNADTNLTESAAKIEQTKGRVRGSHSPDVIPIVPEPETLVIDSSSESEEKSSTTVSKMAKKRKTSDSIELVKEQKALEEKGEKEENEGEGPQAKELRLSDAEEGEIFEEEEEEKEVTEKEIEEELSKQNNSVDSMQNVTKQNEPQEDETEAEKEILNKEAEKLIINNDDAEKSENINEQISTINETSILEETTDKINIEENVKIGEKTENKESKPLPGSEQNLKQMVYTVNEDGNDDNVNNDNVIVIENNNNDNEHDDDYDEDDIISLEGGDLEMIDPDEGTNQSTDSKERVERQLNVEYDDIISLDSSGDELIKDEEAAAAAAAAVSWQDRYLKSSKVNRVLTASRLNKRVREKLKAQKRETKAAVEESEARGRAIALLREEKNKKSFLSKHADGTIEQYKELLEMQKQQNK